MKFQIIPQFNDIHRDLAWIKNRMVTEDFLEERLERFRVDLGAEISSSYLNGYTKRVLTACFCL